MKKIKITEGRGYVSGDYECWCIHPISFDEWSRKHMEFDEDVESVYPNDFFPKDVDYEGKVRYKITVEVEEITEVKKE